MKELDPHQPLRDDVRLLGQLLGSVLKKQCGESFFDLVENVRQVSKKARNHKKEDLEAFRNLLKDLKPQEMTDLARAFSLFLNLSNSAESQHRVRRRRAYDLDPEKPSQPGSVEAVISSLSKSGTSMDQIATTLKKMSIGLTLTAHPTEVTRRTLQHKYHRIADWLHQKDRPDLTRQEHADILGAIEEEITSLWMTSELRDHRPTPLDEAQGGLAIIEQVLWDAIPQFFRKLDQALKKNGGSPLALDVTPLHFDSWMGGDRDGNPSVTPEITRKAVHLARWMAAELYYAELSKMVQQLSMGPCSDELTKIVGHVSEPYRTFLRPFREKMRFTAQYHFRAYRNEPHPRGESWTEETQTPFVNTEEILNPLKLCHRSLVETGAANVADGALTDLIRRVHVFHLSLVKLDVRQESTRHSALLSQITRALSLGDYQNWTEEQKQEFLVKELSSPRPLIPRDLSLEEKDADTLGTFRVLAELPSDSLGAYVISMARQPSDILAVELLQRECGVRSPLRVVPLFEQVEDLRRAKDTLERLFSLPWYHNHIQGRQEIMIGYSDSAKTAGRLTASWDLYRAQEEITEVCRKFNIEFCLFHGRGGTVSRGGGPTFEAITSQPPGSIQNSMRVTEQGEMIQAKFGIPGLAIRNLELYVSGFLEAVLRPPPIPQKSWRERMDEMSTLAEKSFRALIEKPDFISYFHSATPEHELSLLNIGSRPAHRKSAQGLSSLRAIPWSFAWTQTRLHLPAWLGVETGFDVIKNAPLLSELRDMYQKWPFFRSTVGLFEMVLAKSDRTVAEHYDEILVPKELLALGEDLRQRLDQVMAQVLKITGHNVLLENNPVLKRSIEVRNPYVDPLNYMQVELLRQIRSQPESAVLQAALLITINGIAAGMRNTG